MAKDLDWTKTGTVAGMAEWICAKSDALCVLVIRVNNGVLVAHPDVAPNDAGELILDRLADLVSELRKARDEKRKAARRELEPVRE